MSVGRSAAVIVCALMLGAPVSGYAHDVPSDVTVVALVKPEGQRLRLVVRLPLKAVDTRGFVFGSVDIPRREFGHLVLDQLDKPLHDAGRLVAGLIDVYKGDRLLDDPQIAAVRVSLPSDRSFGSYEEAVAHTAAPPSQMNISWDEGFFDTMLDYRIGSERSDFSMDFPGIQALGQRVVIALRFVPANANGQVLGYEIAGDAGRFRLDPRWYHASLAFVRFGFMHVVSGIDHLLFLFCLVIPFRRVATLIPIVTSFTVAHSITLIASAYHLAPGGVWFPPLIETLIAASIVYMALENIIAANLRRRLLITFGFGLVHGFGFSFALRETLQFAGSHLLGSLVSFNVGVELAQISVLALFVPALAAFFRSGVPDRVGGVILSALAADTGWHWLGERAQQLTQVEWPLLAVPSALTRPRLQAIVAILVWLVSAALWRRSRIAAVRRRDRSGGEVLADQAQRRQAVHIARKLRDM